jgi:Predicted hydrolases or acyltransferases (alpha/beta hydrolase superfamily)
MILGYEMFGQGPHKVVVLHDWFCDHTSYIPALPYLDSATFEYIFIDLRGYGLSQSKTGTYTVEEATQDILETLVHIGWDHFHLIGYSMSALIGQLVCARARDKVTSFIAVTPVTAKGMPEADEDAFAFMQAAALDDDTKAMTAAHLMTSHHHTDTFAAYKVKRWHETAIAEARVGYCRMFVKTDILSQVQGLSVPIGVICTSHDNEAHRRAVIQQTFVQWFPHVEIMEIQNAGHYPMQETPVAFADCVNTFLLKHLK